jgi:tripartite-type tricarboxylate transporter receptor subunit TctC
MIESGVPDYIMTFWSGVVAPAGTPAEIVARLNKEVVACAASADYHAQLAKLGFEPFASSPEQYAAFLKSELERWGKVIRAANIRIDR